MQEPTPNDSATDNATHVAQGPTPDAPTAVLSPDPAALTPASQASPAAAPQPAGRGLRFLGGVLDFITAMFVTYAGVSVYAWLAGLEHDATLTRAVLLGWLVLLPCLGTSRSLGKRAFGLQVESLDPVATAGGSELAPVAFGKRIARGVLKMVLYPLNALLALATVRGRHVGDRVAHTHVVRARAWSPAWLGLSIAVCVGSAMLGGKSLDAAIVATPAWKAARVVLAERGDAQLQKAAIGPGEAVFVTNHGNVVMFRAPNGKYVYVAAPSPKLLDALFAEGATIQLTPAIFATGTHALLREAFLENPRELVTRQVQDLIKRKVEELVPEVEVVEARCDPFSVIENDCALNVRGKSDGMADAAAAAVDPVVGDSFLGDGGVVAFRVSSLIRGVKVTELLVAERPELSDIKCPLVVTTHLITCTGTRQGEQVNATVDARNDSVKIWQPQTDTPESTAGAAPTTGAVPTDEEAGTPASAPTGAPVP